ncbi:MAG: D-alanyl-D-alanine carboxypeptidase family protein [Lachnospiraceae bacterium]
MKRRLLTALLSLALAGGLLFVKPEAVQAASLKVTGATANVPESIPLTAESAVLYDMNRKQVCAQKNPTARMEPGDLARLCALLVACENIYSPADRVTITKDLQDAVRAQGGTNLFKPGESVSVQDLYYATALTGADDAVLALGRKAAGSDAVFALLLNRKANQLGLHNTYFANAAGIPGQGSYISAEDAVILTQALLANKTACSVLLADNWTIGATAQHPDGIQIGTNYKMGMNLMPVPGMDTFGDSFTAGGTYGALSMFTSWTGKPYLCVTLGSDSYEESINDQANLFLSYIPGT